MKKSFVVDLHGYMYFKKSKISLSKINRLFFNQFERKKACLANLYLREDAILKLTFEFFFPQRIERKLLNFYHKDNTREWPSPVFDDKRT